MNTTGFIRGYIAKNMTAESFINVIIEALSKEFQVEVKINNISKGVYEIKFNNYRVNLNDNLINELKSKSPYAVDKFLLSELREQGFDFDERRSQYIRYCFVHFETIDG